jgi:hypothetical protein
VLEEEETKSFAYQNLLGLELISENCVRNVTTLTDWLGMVVNYVGFMYNYNALESPYLFMGFSHITVYFDLDD